MLASVVVDRVTDVNVHNHTKTCRKYETKCRFDFPRYPSNFTIISQEMPCEVKKVEEETLKGIDYILKEVKTKLTELDNNRLERKKESENKIKNSDGKDQIKSNQSHFMIQESLDDILEACFPVVRLSKDQDIIVITKDDHTSYKIKV